MRRFAASLAIVCTTSLVPCLGTCLSLGDEAQAHACCRRPERALRAATVAADCCSVTAGVRCQAAAVVAIAPASTASIVALPRELSRPFEIASAAVPTPSPPLVLRI